MHWALTKDRDDYRDRRATLHGGGGTFPELWVTVHQNCGLPRPLRASLSAAWPGHGIIDGPSVECYQGNGLQGGLLRNALLAAVPLIESIVCDPCFLLGTDPERVQEFLAEIRNPSQQFHDLADRAVNYVKGLERGAP